MSLEASVRQSAELRPAAVRALPQPGQQQQDQAGAGRAGQVSQSKHGT